MLSTPLRPSQSTRAFPPLGYFRFLTYTNALSGKPLSHFLGGVRYALPPTGRYRWRKPYPLPSDYRYGTREKPADCVRGTKMCPQGQIAAGHGVDEDCLQLNIWIPVGDAPADG